MKITCPKCQTENPQGAEHCQNCGTFMGKRESTIVEFLSPKYPKTFIIRDEAHRAKIVRGSLLFLITFYVLGFVTYWLTFAPRSEAEELPAPIMSPTAPQAAEIAPPTRVIATTVISTTSTLLPSSTPQPTYLPASTAGPQPTLTAVPTAIPVPTATAISTTPPGTILEPGQTWYEDGLALTLNASPPTGDRLSIDLAVENQAAGSQPIVSIIDPTMVRLTANTGESVTIVPPVQHSVRTGSGFTRATNMTLALGDRFVLAQGGFFRFDFANPNVTSVTIEVVNFARIERAAWRVVIPR